MSAKNNQLVSPHFVAPSSIPLPEDAQQELRMLEQGITQKMVMVGQIDYQLALLEKQKTDLIQTIHNDHETKNRRIHEIAKSVGLDPEDPEVKGRWNIDFNAQPLAFQRIR
jgi:hypothetical protein